MGDRRAAVVQFNAGVNENTAAREGKGDPAVAYQLHSSAALNDTSMGMAWHELGNVVSDLGSSAAAIAAYRLALACPANGSVGDMDNKARGKSLAMLGHRLHVLGWNEEGEKCIRQAIKLNDKDAGAWNCLSLVQSIKGEHDDAVASSYAALSLEPDNATIETALALNLLFRGNFKTGLKHFEARYRYKLHQFLKAPYPQWDGSPGKKVYLLADQGIGDSLSFARFVEQAASRCKFIWIGCQKELVRLLRASLQHLPNVQIDVSMANGWPPAEAWTTFVSLPTALDLSEDEIRNAPHIWIPRFDVSMSWKNPDKKFHVGVAWRGSTASDIDHLRSFPVEHLLRLYECSDVQLYSIQVGDKSIELHAARAAALIRDMTPFIMDIADTTAVIRNLDLVVTVESALGHIASACDKECWIPYARRGRDYRASHDGSTPIWSPKHRFFRQYEDERWEPVFTDIVTALVERVGRC